MVRRSESTPRQPSGVSQGKGIKDNWGRIRPFATLIALRSVGSSLGNRHLKKWQDPHELGRGSRTCYRGGGGGYQHAQIGGRDKSNMV